MDWPNKLYDLFISHFAEQIGKKKVKISVDLYLKKHSLFSHELILAIGKCKEMRAVGNCFVYKSL